MPVSTNGDLFSIAGSPIDQHFALSALASIAESAGVVTNPDAIRHTYIIRYLQAFANSDPSNLPLAINAVCQQTGERPEVIAAKYLD